MSSTGNINGKLEYSKRKKPISSLKENPPISADGEAHRTGAVLYLAPNTWAGMGVIPDIF
jgi:hypothetical protein